jgi:hypothetical protein
MAAMDTISRWFDEGKESGEAYMLVVTDTFNYEDYPSYASSLESAQAQVKQYANGSMTRVMEVYDLNADKWVQLRSVWTWSLPDA